MMSFLVANARWLATGVLLAFASSFGQTWFISIFAGEIRAAYGLSNGGWGGIYTVATLASATLLLLRGSLVDTMALSRLAPLIALLFCAAAALMAVSPSVWLLGVAVFLLRFCGQGMMTHMAVTAMARWFVATRGRAIAIASLGHPLGEATLPLVFVGLIAGIGWRGTWGLTAAILLCLIAPAIWLLLARDREPMAATPLGADASAGLGNHHWTRSEALHHWLFLALLPYLLTPGFIGTVIFFHQVHIAEVKGWSLELMAPAYVVWASVTVVFSLVAGWAADRFGPERLLPVALLPMGASMLMIGPAETETGWIVLLGTMAVTQGLQGSMFGALLPRVYGTRHLGAIRSVQMAVMVVSSAIGPGITGLFIDLGVDFPRQGIAMAAWCFGLSLVTLPVALRIGRDLGAAAASEAPRA